VVSKRRGRSEGAVYRRKSDRLWLGVVDLGWQDGKRARKYVSARTRAEVVEKLRALQARCNSGLPPPDNRITVGELVEHWLTDVLPGSVGSVNTIDNYTWAARDHIIPALGRKRLLKLTPAEVAEFLRAKAEAGMAKSSVSRLRSVLVAALSHAVLEGLVGRNVAGLVRGPRGSTPDGRSLTVNQARALLRAAQGDRLEAAYVTMLMLGLRPGGCSVSRGRTLT
jgi:integrase-like protein